MNVEKFNKAVRLARETSEIAVSNHFREAAKMIELGSGEKISKIIKKRKTISAREAVVI